MHTRERYQDILDQIAETLLGTDDDIYVGLSEAGVDPDLIELTPSGSIPGLQVRQCRDCGYWVRNIKSHARTCGKNTEK